MLLISVSDKLKNSSILASLKEGLDVVFNALDFDQTVSITYSTYSAAVGYRTIAAVVFVPSLL